MGQPLLQFKHLRQTGNSEIIRDFKVMSKNFIEECSDIANYKSVILKYDGVNQKLLEPNQKSLQLLQHQQGKN